MASLSLLLTILPFYYPIYILILAASISPEVTICFNHSWTRMLDAALAFPLKTQKEKISPKPQMMCALSHCAYTLPASHHDLSPYIAMLRFYWTDLKYLV